MANWGGTKNDWDTEDGVFYTDVNKWEDNDQHMYDLMTVSAGGEASKYALNTKLVDNGHSISDWSAVTGATINEDATYDKIGGISMDIINALTSGTLVYAIKESISLDLTKVSGGLTSSTSDFIRLVFYISDIDAVSTSGVFVHFSQNSTFSTTNAKSYAIPKASLVEGWNYVDIVKSDFTTNGTGAWSGVQSIAFGWTSSTSYNDEFVALQLIQLTLVDPDDSTIPTAIQSNGNSELDVSTSGEELYVVEEYGKFVIKMLDSDQYIRFVPYVVDSCKLRLDTTVTTTTSSRIGWNNDSVNAYAQVISGTTLRIHSTSDFDVTLLESVSAGDRVEITFERVSYSRYKATARKYNSTIVSENYVSSASASFEGNGYPFIYALEDDLIHNISIAGNVYADEAYEARKLTPTGKKELIEQFGEGYLPSDFYGNVKTVLACEQARESITFVSGSYSQSNVKIGEYTCASNIASSPVMNVTFSSKDLSKLNGGKIVDLTNDFIVVPVTIGGTTAPSSLNVEVSSSLSVDTDEYQLNSSDNSITPELGFKNYKFKLSTKTTTGSPNIENIVRVRVFASGGSADNQLFVDEIQFVKADPETKTYPQPFQINGKSVFDINSGEWFVGEEFGEIKIIELGSSSVGSVNALTSVNRYNNGVITGQISGVSPWRRRGISAYVDASNYAVLSNELDELTLTLNIGGSVSYYKTSMPFDEYDAINFKLCVQNGKVYAQASVNNNIYYIPEQDFVDSSWVMGIGGYANVVQEYNSLSCTELQLAARSEYAFRAGSLDEQAYLEVQTSGTQSVPDSTMTTVIFDSVDHDNRDRYNSTTGVYTIPKTSKYDVIANIRFASSSAGLRIIVLYANSSEIGRVVVQPVAGLSMDIQCTNVVKKLNSGDTIFVNVYQTSGGALDVQTGANYVSKLTINEIAG